MVHLDLFSGIGGFSLAAKWVWGKDHNIHSFVEIDPFCQKVLKKHWPEVPIISDIKEYKHDGTTIDLLTGGFPCQPFSCAGKQRGKEDDRYLWPEMLRVVSEVHPSWIIGENVSGIINMGLDQVLSDLEDEGYTCQPFIVPACAVNAPHRRDRVWIVANSTESRLSQPGLAGIGELQAEDRKGLYDRPEQQNSHAPDTLIKNDGGYLREKEKRQIPELRNDIEQGTTIADTESKQTQPTEQERFHTEPCGKDTDVADSSNKGLQGGKRAGAYEEKETAFRPASECNNAWNEPWLEVATRLCRVDDGISSRVDRLKSLGNAIVPQVVVPIMQAIREINSKTTHNP